LAFTGTDAGSQASHPRCCRSVTTATGPLRPDRFWAAADNAARYRVAPKPADASLIAVLARTRSDVGFTPISARSENVTTPTRSPAGARSIAALASCFARSKRPGADMLYDVSRATIVTPDEATAAPVAKNGRAKASAS